MTCTTVDDLHKKWMNNPKYRREYEALEEEFSLSAALIEAGARAGQTDRKTPQNQLHAGRGGPALPTKIA